MRIGGQCVPVPYCHIPLVPLDTHISDRVILSRERERETYVFSLLKETELSRLRGDLNIGLHQHLRAVRHQRSHTITWWEQTGSPHSAKLQTPPSTAAPSPTSCSRAEGTGPLFLGFLWRTLQLKQLTVWLWNTPKYLWFDGMMENAKVTLSLACHILLLYIVSFIICRRIFAATLCTQLKT